VSLFHFKYLLILKNFIISNPAGDRVERACDPCYYEMFQSEVMQVHRKSREAVEKSTSNEQVEKSALVGLERPLPNVPTCSEDTSCDEEVPVPPPRRNVTGPNAPVPAPRTRFSSINFSTTPTPSPRTVSSKPEHLCPPTIVLSSSPTSAISMIAAGTNEVPEQELHEDVKLTRRPCTYVRRDGRRRTLSVDTSLDRLKKRQYGYDVVTPSPLRNETNQNDEIGSERQSAASALASVLHRQSNLSRFSDGSIRPRCSTISSTSVRQHY
jgi:hypothetical protein